VLPDGRDKLRIVGIGGGTGLPVLMTGLRRELQQGRRTGRVPLDLTAIVSVADDGGSTGRLRHDLGIPAVGDLRNCIVALAGGASVWRELFQHRFTHVGDGDGLGGHALGNLVMAALVQREGGLAAAIAQLERPLRLKGRILPATERWVELAAELDDGRVVCGESRIPACGRPIRRLGLTPSRVPPAPGVLEALANADAIVIGPGSLFTSLLPVLMVDGIAAAIRRSPGLRIHVSNLMTQPGETDGYEPLDHLRRLEEVLGAGAIDVCLLNRTLPPPDVLARYAAAGARPLPSDPRPIAAAGVLPVVVDLLSGDRDANRHDPSKLGELVVSLARCLRRELGADIPRTMLDPRPRAASMGGE